MRLQVIGYGSGACECVSVELARVLDCGWWAGGSARDHGGKPLTAVDTASLAPLQAQA